MRTPIVLPACLLVFLASASSSAHQAASQHPFAQTENFAPEPKSVAVIGAGAAGTSFAYLLRQAVPDTDAKITILEATSRIGGRASSIEFEGASIEIGASIFLKENEHLYNASKRFNLTLVSSSTEPKSGSDDRWGIWSTVDRSFRFVSSTSSKLTLARMVWRYGFRAPYEVSRLARQAAASFGRGAYSVPATTPVPPTLAGLIADFKLVAYASQLGRPFLGVNDLYLDEIVASAMRVNYGQDLHADLPALPPLISMAAATGEVTAVENGNQQIFEHFAVNAEASIHFEKRVTEIELVNSTSKPYKVSTADGATAYYDAVAIAVPNPPFKLVNIARQPTIHPYVQLHVTLVAGTAPNPSYFGANPPERILTCMDAVPAPGAHRFNSISHLGNGTYKIFSPAEPSPEQLAQWFKPVPTVVAHYKWGAYPVFGTDAAGAAQDQPVMLDDQLFYLNAFEHIFSTMESQTAVAKRVASYVAEWILSES
ncbi:hypothetical protein HDU87_005941 [Geranomyces variabilis]|uniref:Prenylcysteine lyase domain-containing protein n=1 Tax=Geranomyces variabilis TaxID=109894 RepID=A0AAD5TQ78_9FUNG|nr:hypothetical protein HDU87_005941 [Geranomyces variabilis]